VLSGVSSENVEIFRQMLELFDQGDREAWIELHDPLFELRPTPTWPEADVLRGPEAGWDFYRSVMEPWQSQPLSAAAQLIDAGADKVLAHHRLEVRGRASGALVEMDLWVVTSFQGGRVLRDQWFTDRGEALEAAGLPS
jgi:ketosteroid isomerase-like protein